MRLRHWQAATCVALTVFSSISPLLADAQQQQNAQSQTQLESEFDALAPTTVKKAPTPSTTRPGTVSQGSSVRPGTNTSEITIPAGTVRPGTNVRPGTVVPVESAQTQAAPSRPITSLPQPPDDSVPAASSAPVQPATTVVTTPAAAPAATITAQQTQDVPASQVHPIVLPEAGAAPAKVAATKPAKTPKVKASKKTPVPAPTDTEDVLSPAPPPPVVRPIVPMPVQQTQVNPTQAAKAGVIQNDTTGAKGLPQAPGPTLTQPLYLRPSAKDYGKGKPGFVNPLLWYTAKSYPQPRLSNSPRLDDLLRDGKIYLSLSDAVTLALENNYDIAIARINLDIADTDLLRAKAGSSLRGVSTGLVTNTLGGSSSTITGGGGPGGTSSGTGGGGAGASGLVLSTNGGGPVPEALDPSLTSQLEYEALVSPQAPGAFLSGGKTETFTNTGTFDFGYAQGFLTGTSLNTTYNNIRTVTNNTFNTYSPEITASFRATVTQHLLQGFGTGINGRFIIQAKNDRRITDSAFRQQVLYTVNQIENIYWGLVSAYEDEQAKERALVQSTALTSDNRKQLEIGTLAPLDVVNSDATVATDRQALIASQTNLEYQQLIMKQAIARNLNDPQLSGAPVIPTDRVGLERLKEEDMGVEDLVREAYQNNPQIEQAVLNMKNNEITIKAEKNGLLPIVDAYGFYGASALAGAQSPYATNPLTGAPYTPGSIAAGSYSTAFGNLFNSTSPDKGFGVNVTIPLRNRTAQADQMRSQMELRQSQMRLQQLYTQIRIQVINGQYALTNDRAQVAAAQASRDYAAQSSEAEQKKYKLGASTSANVLQQGRNLAVAENSLISATAAYAKDRAALLQLVSNTLEVYGINLTAAAAGTVAQAPVIPGLTAPKPPAPAKSLSPSR